jgi:hypothetical protein
MSYMWSAPTSSPAEGGLPPLASLSFVWMFTQPSNDTYSDAHVIFALFLKMVLGVVTIVKGLSQCPIRCHLARTMLHGTKKLKKLPWRLSSTYLFVICRCVKDRYLGL